MSRRNLALYVGGGFFGMMTSVVGWPIWTAAIVGFLWGTALLIAWPRPR